MKMLSLPPNIVRRSLPETHRDSAERGRPGANRDRRIYSQTDLSVHTPNSLPAEEAPAINFTGA